MIYRTVLLNWRALSSNSLPSKDPFDLLAEPTAIAATRKATARAFLAEAEIWLPGQGNSENSWLVTVKLAYVGMVQRR